MAQGWYGIMQIIRDHLLLSAGRHTESVRIRPAPPAPSDWRGCASGAGGLWHTCTFVCSLPPFAQSLMSVCVDIFAQSARLCTEPRTKTHE